MSIIIGGKTDGALYAFLLKHRVQVIILFVAAAAVCAVLSGLVGVNYKFADYLPEEAASTRAIEVMEEEYSQAVPNMRVLVYDVSIPEALEYKDRLKTAEGVQEVSWLDDAVNIYEPLEMAPQKTIDEWYKDGNALFSVTVDEEKEEEAVAAVREIIGDETVCGSCGRKRGRGIRYGEGCSEDHASCGSDHSSDSPDHNQFLV